MAAFMPRRAAATFTAKRAQEHVEHPHRVGNVNLQLPADAAFDADISSSSGSVTLGHPVTTTVQGRVQESRKSVVGKVRAAGRWFRCTRVGRRAGRLIRVRELDVKLHSVTPFMHVKDIGKALAFFNDILGSRRFFARRTTRICTARQWVSASWKSADPTGLRRAIDGLPTTSTCATSTSSMRN